MAPESELNRFDVERELKRARSLLRDPAGREALRRITGYNFVLGEDARADAKPIVAVLTPSMEGPKAETHKYIEAMVQASKPHAAVYLEPYVSASIIHWVRNDLLVRLYKSGKPFDYVLLVDDDMAPEPEALVKLLAHKKDIVAAACTVRRDPPLPNFRTYDPKTHSFITAFEWNGEGLMEVGGVGTAFMLLSRKALETVADYYLNCIHERTYFGMSQEQAEKISAQRFASLKETHNAWWFEFLKHPNGDGEFGEDISFCFKAKHMGLSVWVDTTVKVGHFGSYPYTMADYMDHKAALLEQMYYQRMFKSVTGWPKDVTVREEENAGPTHKVSVLIPSRGRPEMLVASVRSLYATASDPRAVEVLVRLDEDDESASPTGLKSMIPAARIRCGSRHGYRNLNLYYNELAEHACGDWLVLWNDDALMETEGWDAKIHEHGAGLKLLNATGELNIFPIVSRQLYEALGCLSPQTHSDSWLQVVARVNGIEYPVGISIKHQREEIEDKTKEITGATYAESRPEFFSEKFQRMLRADCEKIGALLAQPTPEAKPEEVPVG